MKAKHAIDMEPIWDRRLMEMLIAHRLHHNPHLLARPHHVLIATAMCESGGTTRLFRCSYGPLRCSGSVSTPVDGDK